MRSKLWWKKRKNRTFWVDIDNVALMEPLRHSWAKPHKKAWCWRNDFSESTSCKCPIQQSHQTTSPAHPSLWRLEACFVLLPMEESLMSTTPTLCIFHHLTRPKPASFSLYTSPFTSLPTLPLSRCLQNMIWYFTILFYFKRRKVYLSYNVAYLNNFMPPTTINCRRIPPSGLFSSCKLRPTWFQVSWNNSKNRTQISRFLTELLVNQ